MSDEWPTFVMQPVFDALLPRNRHHVACAGSCRLRPLEHDEIACLTLILFAISFGFNIDYAYFIEIQRHFRCDDKYNGKTANVSYAGIIDLPPHSFSVSK